MAAAAALMYSYLFLIFHILICFSHFATSHNLAKPHNEVICQCDRPVGLWNDGSQSVSQAASQLRFILLHKMSKDQKILFECYFFFLSAVRSTHTHMLFATQPYCIIHSLILNLCHACVKRMKSMKTHVSDCFKLNSEAHIARNIL